ncbi:MAG: hypothetical protein MI725_16965 [Pirellulales bacterium]|nr:hypothetical protein [Pirellulales bacterium]
MAPAVCVCLVILGSNLSAIAVTPESPEVRKLIEEGKKYLEKNTDHRLGGKCLIALAFLKDGASVDHPRILEALEACRKTSAEQARKGDVYSNGLAIIFLAELENGKHKELLSRFAGTMAHRQKPNGAWGYDSSPNGDTSQTQYAALCYWELLQVGMAPPVENVEACTNWLLRTQDPSGAWGYHGVDTDGKKLVNQNKVSLSMMAAGMGATMIYGNILGILNPGGGVDEAEQSREEIPEALRRADTKPQMRTLSGSGVDRQKLKAAVARGQKWYEKNFSAKAIRSWSHYACYLLYSLERYKSFEELLTGDAPEEPQWYQIGYQYLKEKQLDHGGWRSESEDPCATAFAVLFLLRSTQKSIKASLGQGTLIGGRGLSADLSRMKLRGGRLVTQHKPTEVDQLLGMLEGSGSEELDALLSDPASLRVNKVGPQEARRLQQVVKSGTPEARLLAVHALSRLRNLDYVPSLLYAMTDPDKRVVREARDGLRFVSRRFGGFGLPDNFTDSERYNALDKWKTWYRRLRPDAILLP